MAKCFHNYSRSFHSSLDCSLFLLLLFLLFFVLWPFFHKLQHVDTPVNLQRLTTVQTHNCPEPHVQQKNAVIRKQEPFLLLSYALWTSSVHPQCSLNKVMFVWHERICVWLFATGLWKNEFDAVGACHWRWGKSVKFSYVTRFRFLSHAAKITLVLWSSAAGITRV